MDPTHLQIPEGHGLAWLDGLPLPATKEDALAFAERRGAPAGVLAFLEALPAAVFTSEAGLHHVFGGVGDDELEVERQPPPSEDGPAS